MEVDVGTLVVAGVFVAAQVFQTLQIAILGRDVRKTLRPPPAFKRALRLDDDDDAKTSPRGRR